MINSNAFVSVRDGNNNEIERLPALEVPLDYPNMSWRADPATAITSDGCIFSAIEKRLFTSSNGGYNWSWLPIEFENFNYVQGFGVLNNDTLLLLYREESKGMAIARSTDSGKNWTRGTSLNIDPYKGEAGADANKFCQLPDGSVIVTVSLKEDHVYHSTNGGQTWDERNILLEDSFESNFLSLGENNVLAVIRRQRLENNEPPGAWQKTGSDGQLINKVLFLANSNDGGRTWTNERQLTKLHGDCPGELIRLSDGRIVVLYCHRYPYGHGNTTALVSNDNGITWSQERYIVSIGSGYSGSVVLADDTIVTVCGNTQLNELAPDSGRFTTNGIGHNAEPWQAHSVRWRLPG